MKSLSDVCDWVGPVDGNPTDSPCCRARSSLLTVIGNPALVRQLVAIPLEHYETAAAAWKVEVTQADTTNNVEPTPVERGRPGVIRRVARLLMKLTPDELVPAGQGGSGGATVPFELQGLLQAAQASVGRPIKKIIVSKVPGQGDDSEVAPLDAEHFDKLIDDWKTNENDGEEPSEEEEATMEQLATLGARLKCGAAPFADFWHFDFYGGVLEAVFESGSKGLGKKIHG